MNIKPRIDKENFKQIFRENWNEFIKENPEYNSPYYGEVIEKMLNCGYVVSGYSVYVCSHCGSEEKTIAFSCKGCFCLSCGKVYSDNWVSHISSILRPGLSYRHIVLTMPDSLHKYFRQNAKLLYSELMKSGVSCLEDLLKTVRRQELKGGYIVVLHTSGRSGRYNPHLHIIMTDGGISESSGKWVDLGYFPYAILHKKWQYHLLEMLREALFTNEIDKEVNRMWKTYPRGFVAHIQGKNVPKKYKNLAKYLGKYVLSPPISIKRILNYDGEEVTYWYRDHKTSTQKIETVDVLTFIKRMVQHILPKGFKRIRYYGLQATKTFEKLKSLIGKALRLIGRRVNRSYEIIFMKKYRERYSDFWGKDPFICSVCGEEMLLWKIWHPKYGIIYDELEEGEKRFKYRELYEELEKTKRDENEQKMGFASRRIRRNGRSAVLQLSLPNLWA